MLENETVESVVLNHLWPWLEEIKAQVPGTTIWYSFNYYNREKIPDAPDCPRALFFCCLPHSAIDDCFLWNSRTAERLTGWEQRGETGKTFCGIHDIDRELAIFGGPQGLRIHQELEELLSYQLLEFCALHGALTTSKDKAQKASDLAYLVIRNLSGEVDSSATFKILQGWTKTLGKLHGPDFKLESVETALPQLEKLLEGAMSAFRKPVSARDSSWEDVLSSVKRQLVPFGSEIKKNMSSISENGAFEDWFGRRLVHPIFVRVNLAGAQECALLLAIANLILQGKLS